MLPGSLLAAGSFAGQPGGDSLTPQPGNAFQTTQRLMSNARGRLNVTFMITVGTRLSPV